MLAGSLRVHTWVGNPPEVNKRVVVTHFPTSFGSDCIRDYDAIGR